MAYYKTDIQAVLAVILVALRSVVVELQREMRLLTFTSLLLSIGVGITFAATTTYDGKPGCKTPAEAGQFYRNFWDPMRFWHCIGLNMEPLQEACPDGTGFQQTLNLCVPWNVWRWETPQYPPSCPDGVMCLTTELRPMSSLSSVPLHSLRPSETLIPVRPLPQSLPFMQQQASVEPQRLQPVWPISASQPLPSKRPMLPLSSPQSLDQVQTISSLRPLSPNDSSIQGA